MAVDGWETSSLIARPGRWVGLVLLAAVVVIVVAVPPADGRLVAGRPQAAGLSAAPRPGQCLTVPLFDRGLADATPVYAGRRPDTCRAVALPWPMGWPGSTRSNPTSNGCHRPPTCPPRPAPGTPAWPAHRPPCKWDHSPTP